MKNLFFAFAVTLLSPIFLLADSPITSTPFHTAYSDHPIIIKAKNAGGVLNDELMDYLYKKKNPIDVKLALINTLSWDINGKSNYPKFLEYLGKKKKKYNSLEGIFKKGKSELLICLAYLKAMDNYFNLQEAVKIADKAIEKNKKGSYSIALVGAIIKAQEAFDYNWCRVFELTDQVRRNEDLTMDMKPAASSIIFEYMDLYKSSCGE